MIGVVLVSHGELARAILDTAQEIVGPIAATPVAIGRRDSLDKAEARLRQAIQSVDQGEGVLVIADMFGGTASNIALHFLEDEPVEVVTGFNLPMILKLAGALPTATDLVALSQLLRYYGQRNVLVASEVLKEREQSA